MSRRSMREELLPQGSDMSKHIFCGLSAFIFVLLLTSYAIARPCTPQEQQAHKFFSQQTGNGTCFKPDPHPMPHGIAWPGAKALGDSYIYFINSSSQPIKIYTLQQEEEGEAPSAYHMTTLSSRTYTWDGLDSFGDYALIAGNARTDLDEEREYLKKDGPVIYKFYDLQVKGGRVVFRKINEAAAIALMKAMKYSKRNPNGEKLK